MKIPGIPNSSAARQAVLVSLLLLAGAFLLISVAVRHLAPGARRLLPGRGETTVTHGVVVEQMQAVAKLVSSETTVRDVVVYRNVRLGSTKRSLVVVTGKVLAGLDLDAGTQVDIDHQARRVAVVLPHAKVLGVEGRGALALSRCRLGTLSSCWCCFSSATRSRKPTTARPVRPRSSSTR